MDVLFLNQKIIILFGFVPKEAHIANVRQRVQPAMWAALLYVAVMIEIFISL
jgi:hypothetical protein